MATKKPIKPYTIRQGDTLQGIAQAMVGDPAKWYEIAIYNKLTYPYIDEGGRSFGQKASGEVSFYVDVPTGSNITIPEGLIVTTAEKVSYGAVSGYTNKYVTKKSVVLSGSAISVRAEIEAIGYGEVGNVFEGEITEIVRKGAGAGLDSQVKVINSGLITGGTTGKVLTVGDMLLIPQLDDGRISNEFSLQTTYFDMLMGRDLYLGGEGTDKPNDERVELSAIYDKDLSTSESEALNGFGGMDLRAVSGVDNLIQAILHRMVTEKGELPYHPEYGSLLPKLVGKPGTQKNIRLLETEAIATCLEDPRVESVYGLTMQYAGFGAYAVEFTVKPIGINSAVRGNFIADFRR